MEELTTLIQMLSDLISHFKEMAIAAQVAAILTFIIAVWKSSFLRPYWDKMGAGKVMVAPVLSLLVAIVAIQPLNGAMLAQALLGGVLALPLSEVFQAAESIPGFGEKYKTYLQFVEKLLGRPAAPKA